QRVSIRCQRLIGKFISFFFSSRRRHTRSKRDWSSDVCSSDLPCWVGIPFDSKGIPTQQGPLAGLRYVNVVSDTGALDIRIVDIEIGRASCRERVGVWGVEGGVEGKEVEASDGRSDHDD